MRKKRSIFGIIFELIILYLFSGLMFNLGLITGILYLVAITLAVFNGVLFRRRGIGFLIVFGTILTFIAGKLVFITIDNALAGDIVGAAIFLIIAIVIWIKGTKLKLGK